MWLEPLIARVIYRSETSVLVSILDADDIPVAAVACAVNTRAGCGMFGAIEFLEPGGTRAQQMRAMVMLTRGALDHAAELGVTRVSTINIPPTMRDFAERMSGLRVSVRGGQLHMTGDLADIRTHILDTTDSDGNEREARDAR